MEINNINDSILEICASGGGNFITQSKPTYFHSFLTRKILVGDETMEDFMEVTPAQRTSIEKNDASFVQPPQLFIDQWNAACGSFGRYNPETGYFELNGLTDITYEEAMKIYTLWSNSPKLNRMYGSAKIRTNLPSVAYDGDDFTNMFLFCNTIEVARMGPSDSNDYWVRGKFAETFRRCNKLRKIMQIITSPTVNSLTFEHCGALEDVRIRITANPSELHLGWSPRLSLASFTFLVANKTWNRDVTVYVHPNVYAKLTGDTSNAAAAELTEEELAQWQQLLEDAAEKQITFATT